MSTTTLSAQVVTETAHERLDGTLFAANPDIVILTDSLTAGLRFTGLFRFTGLNIPRGANVTSATLTLSAVDLSSDDPEVEIHCEDVDDSPDVVTLADVADTRVPRVTTASTTWSATGIGTSPVASPDFADALEEVLRRPDYERLTSAIGVILVATNSGAKVFRVSGSMTLDIVYTLLDAQNALAITSTTGVAFALGKKVIELTVQCDTGSAQPVQFKVPGIVDDFFELEAGQSIPVYIAPRAKETRDIFEIIFKVSAGTATASYVTSGI